MGQENSAPVDDSVPAQKLKQRNIESVAEYIKSGQCKQIVVLTGAGISVSAGLPDFRSPDTGLYANLAKLNLPYAEAVFDISYFKKNPLPFYTLAHELYPGKYRPTVSHSFVRLLSDKGLLLKLFTQNIDCLERQAGIPAKEIIEAHGSFANQRCIECKTPYPEELMKQAIDEHRIPFCLTPQCNGIVKPDIVFFGEPLPPEFQQNKHLLQSADLCIVMGTSLTVHPFASLPDLCSQETPRILINLERVGTLGCRPDDVLLLGDCDSGVRDLASALGWTEDLGALWKETEPTGSDTELTEIMPKSRDEGLEDEIAGLMSQIDQSLKISADEQKWLKTHLAQKHGWLQLTPEFPDKAAAVPAKPANEKVSTGLSRSSLPQKPVSLTQNDQVTLKDLIDTKVVEGIQENTSPSFLT